MSTICAIATPLAVGGISVIRISGEDAFKIASKIFSTASAKSVEKMSANTCAYGKIIDCDQEIDDGVVTVFHAPRSYTGENVCEISCHGGVFVTKKVLSLIIKNGAEPAMAGEFTKRAFLNGKMSLTQAEAVMDVISAEGEQALKAAVSTHEGSLFVSIKALTDKLITILGELAAWVDYPEEDLPIIELNNFIDSLQTTSDTLNKLIDGYYMGKIARQGVDTAIVGKPNVGKSTLMNYLTGYDRSIVTDVAGTTRDIVEESVTIGDYILVLSDTAGIRETEDVVENVGVGYAYKKINQSSLVIAVFDGSRELDKDDLDLIDILQDKNCICVINKTDLNLKIDQQYLKDHFEYIIDISAQSQVGVDKLEKCLEEIFKMKSLDYSSGVVANERQKQCLEKANELINMAILDLTNGETYDAVTVLINKAADYLLELTGEKVTEAVVDNVFSRFCVGK